MNAATESPSTSSSPAATLFIVSAVQFLTPFMASAVGVALPAIGRDFGASAVQLSLIQMAYILASSILLLPVGRFADIHGRRRVFIAGTGLIILATLALAFAGSTRLFILFRLFQGFGAAMITATSFAILTSVFPPERRGQAMGIIIGFVYAGLAAGPTLSGVIVTHIGWRWIFFLMVPVETAALWLAVTQLKGEWAESRGESFDWWGSALFAAALTLLITGLTRITQLRMAWGLVLVGGLGLFLFLMQQKKKQSPLLDVDLILSNAVFALSNIATLINYAASFGVIFLFSLYLQYAQGFSPQGAGLILVVQPVTQALLSPLAGRLSDRWPPARVATSGMGLCAVGLMAAAQIGQDTPIEGIIVVMVILGMGFGLFSSPNMSAIMSSVASKHYGTASSLVATMRTQGMLVSMATVTVILAHYLEDQPVTAENIAFFIKSMQLSLTLFSLMSLVGIGFSLGRVRTRKAGQG
jgi:EmrB/QacA subfamily drug resistance transporter